MSKTRKRIIDTASELLEAQGYYATGLNQIIEESGAPKGSLYYYFPAGKEGLTAEVIELTGQGVHERIQQTLASVDDPSEAVRTFVLNVAKHVRASKYRAGGPITTVALETAHTSQRLNAVCKETYNRWESAFRDRLVSSGFPKARAERLATLIIACLEGAIVLSRTKRSARPLERVAEELALLINITSSHR